MESLPAQKTALICETCFLVKTQGALCSVSHAALVFHASETTNCSVLHHLTNRSWNSYHFISPHFTANPCLVNYFKCFVCLIYFLVSPFWGVCSPFYYQSQEFNPLMMQKNNEDFWKCAVLDIFLHACIRSLPGEWVVRLSLPNALPPKQKIHEIHIFSPHETIHFIISLSLCLSRSLCLSLVSVWIYVHTQHLAFSIVVTV